MQRHHILPRQLLVHPAFARMFAGIGGEALHLEDFRRNGMLLPCREPSAIRLGLPLHRGPHRRYSELVMERVGKIEAGWSRARKAGAASADGVACMRLVLLQRALRRYLLERRGQTVMLNRQDPFGTAAAFVELDAMAEMLWSRTGSPVQAPALPRLQPMPARARSSSRAV